MCSNTYLDTTSSKQPRKPSLMERPVAPWTCVQDTAGQGMVTSCVQPTSPFLPILSLAHGQASPACMWIPVLQRQTLINKQPLPGLLSGPGLKHTGVTVLPWKAGLKLETPIALEIGLEPLFREFWVQVPAGWCRRRTKTLVDMGLSSVSVS
jgi:hypothetical protein